MCGAAFSPPPWGLLGGAALPPSCFLGGAAFSPRSFGGITTTEGRDGRPPTKGEMEDDASRRRDAHNKRGREHGYSENTITCGRGGLMLVALLLFFRVTLLLDKKKERGREHHHTRERDARRLMDKEA